MSLIQNLTPLLLQAGVDIPVAPDFKAIKPRKWVIHADTNKNILLTDGEFLVQTADKGAQGVFVFDALSALSSDQDSLFFAVFDSETLSPTWVIEGSEQYEKLQHDVAVSAQLDATNIGSAIEIRSKIYAGQSIYQPMSGVATVNHTVPLAKAVKIFVPQGFLTPEETAKLPASVSGKIVTLQM
ncbi:MAG: hypothetical protein ABI758_01830 [Candidatus Woesebacteria bacterium]